MWARTDLHFRMFVGRDSEGSGGHAREEFFDRLAFTSPGDADDEPARDFAGTSLPAWWNVEIIAGQLAAELPPIETTGEDRAYAAGQRDLRARHRPTRPVPLTEE